MPFEVSVIKPADPRQRAALVDLWNASFPPDLAVNGRMVEYNTRPCQDTTRTGWVVQENGEPVAYALVTAGHEDGLWAHMAWLDALVVRPDCRRRGIASALIDSVLSMARVSHASVIQLGGSLRPFLVGLPAGSEDLDFFIRRGWNVQAFDGSEWDVARDLADYSSSPEDSAVEGDFRLLRQEEEPALIEFLSREFPGRWLYEAEQFFREGGRAEDIMVCWMGERVEAFAWTTTAASLRPIERYYPSRLPGPWAQVGPLGVSRALRKKGYGGAVVDRALRNLQARGMRGCVIDWTGLVDFYARFGFKPYRKYAMLYKEVT